MSGFRFALYGIGTAIFRTRRTVTVKSSFIFSKPIPFTPPQFLRRTSPSSAAAETLSSVDHRLSELVSSVPRLNAKGYLSKPYSSAAAAKTLRPVAVDHPWSEWVSFVDCLIAKGYLPKSCCSHETSSFANRISLEEACLRFGRDRYDLIKLLPRREIRAVVNGRCLLCLPEYLDSAKRLRAYVQLAEHRVCDYCGVRRMCPGDNVVLKNYENEARTVDIVRILFFYAKDPLVRFGGNKPPGRKVIEVYARKLLSRLIELSESPPPPGSQDSGLSHEIELLFDNYFEI